MSEIITHLAFYAGWGNAVAAANITQQVLQTRPISAAQLPQADNKLLPLNEEAEAARATQGDANFGAVSSGVVQYAGEATTSIAPSTAV